MAAVKDIDLGWKRIKGELKLIDKSYTQIGIQKDAGTENGQSIAAIGAYNEFGTGNIPSRSFMRSTFDEQRTKIKAIIEHQYSRILKGEITVKKALGLIGEYMEGEVKKKITTLKTPPNDPRTIAMKGSSNPLIDTGRMRASIRHIEVLKK